MAVDKSFINRKKGYVLPGEFGMFTNRGNACVREALRRFIRLALEWAMRNQVTSREARLAAFQDPNVASRSVHCEKHGEQQETFVCNHVVKSLDTASRVGFW
jgi:hypothetical protein